MSNNLTTQVDAAVVDGLLVSGHHFASDLVDAEGCGLHLRRSHHAELLYSMLKLHQHDWVLCPGLLHLHKKELA